MTGTMLTTLLRRLMNSTSRGRRLRKRGRKQTSDAQTELNDMWHQILPPGGRSSSQLSWLKELLLQTYWIYSSILHIHFTSHVPQFGNTGDTTCVNSCLVRWKGLVVFFPTAWRDHLHVVMAADSDIAKNETKRGHCQPTLEKIKGQNWLHAPGHPHRHLSLRSLVPVSH